MIVRAEEEDEEVTVSVPSFSVKAYWAVTSLPSGSVTLTDLALMTFAEEPTLVWLPLIESASVCPFTREPAEMV